LGNTNPIKKLSSYISENLFISYPLSVYNCVVAVSSTLNVNFGVKNNINGTNYIFIYNFKN